MMQVPLFLFLTTSCMVVDAVKRQQLKPDLDVGFETLRKDGDNHLKLVTQPYATASVESSEAGCDSNSQCSKSVKSGLDLLWELLEGNVDDHVESKLGTYVSTVPPTASGCTKEKHSESSTASGCTTEFHPTTADYSEEKSSAVESTMRSSHNGYTTASSSSVPPRDPLKVGSISGIPGINYPDYTDIPITTFTCSDKSYLPGFYADLEAGCQVFHVCWPNRRESFLCPLGTTFNQAILACDYWYSTDCSMAPHYYNINAENSQNSELSRLKNISLSSMINDLLERNVVDSPDTSTVASTSVLTTPDAALSFISKFLPVKAKVTIYPETTDKRAKVVVSSSIGHDKEKIVLRSSEKTRLSPKQLHSHSKISAPKPTPTQKVPTDDRKHRFEKYDISTEYCRCRQNFCCKDFQIAVDRFFAELLRLVDKMAKESRMEEGKSPYVSDSQTLKYLLEVVPESFKEFDLAHEIWERCMIKKIKNFFKNSSKHADVQKPSEPVNEKSVFTPKPSEPVNVKPTPTPQPIESVKVKKPYVLAQLDPRFIVQAVKIPKKEDQEKSTPHPTKNSKMPVSTVRVVKIRYPRKISFKPVSYSGKSISPETKKALIENYVRLLKVKSG